MWKVMIGSVVSTKTPVYFPCLVVNGRTQKLGSVCYTLRMAEEKCRILNGSR